MRSGLYFCAPPECGLPPRWRSGLIRAFHGLTPVAAVCRRDAASLLAIVWRLCARVALFTLARLGDFDRSLPASVTSSYRRCADRTVPQGARARVFSGVSARLKPCPYGFKATQRVFQRAVKPGPSQPLTSESSQTQALKRWLSPGHRCAEIVAHASQRDVTHVTPFWVYAFHNAYNLHPHIRGRAQRPCNQILNEYGRKATGTRGREWRKALFPSSLNDVRHADSA